MSIFNYINNRLIKIIYYVKQYNINKNYLIKYNKINKILPITKKKVK